MNVNEQMKTIVATDCHNMIASDLIQPCPTMPVTAVVSAASLFVDDDPHVTAKPPRTT
jgi:hypothetical protein